MSLRGVGAFVILQQSLYLSHWNSFYCCLFIQGVEFFEKELQQEGKGIHPSTFCKLGHIHLLLEDFPKGMVKFLCCRQNQCVLFKELWILMFLDWKGENPCSFPSSLQSAHFNGISGLEHVVAFLYNFDVRPLLHIISIHGFSTCHAFHFQLSRPTRSFSTFNRLIIGR